MSAVRCLLSTAFLMSGLSQVWFASTLLHAGAMRFFLANIFAVTMLTAILACRAGAPRSSSAERPNVLLVTIDTLRADHVGCYGYKEASTPTIDGLAARGVRFGTAVAQAPLTGPSHASILTGQIP